jgi:outer membrane PBP1 activator LpoA protein
MKIILFRLIAIFCLVLFLEGCASTGNKSNVSQKTVMQARNLAKSGNHQQAAKVYQKLASEEQSPTKDKLLLRALDLYIRAADNQQAQKTAASINPSSLSSRERVLYHLLYGKSEINLGHQRKALDQLNQVSPSLLARPEQQLYHILQVKALEKLGKDIESVEERIKLSRFLDEGDAFKHNHRKVTKTLALMTPAMLRHHRTSAPQTLRGWIDYTLITQETLPDTTMRERYLQRWQDQYPGHPAVFSTRQNPLPSLDRSPTKTLGVVSNIAVILPHSGSYTAATHAIKQGMMAARDQQTKQAIPRIKFYDSTADDISTIYQRVVRDGAELVIGPLQKQTIQQLLSSVTLDKPMLALNQLDGVSQNNLFQLGLNPRDEIEQAAALAWQDGHRRALIFVPDTNSGQRAGRLFTDYWNAIGGTTLELATYTSDSKELSQSVSLLLNLDESMNRRKRLQANVGKLEFTPRPRHDADMIFMLAKPTVARIIRPLLDFYRVGDLAVYSTSKVYSGRSNTSLDRDLSGIVFCGDNSKFDPRVQKMQQQIGSQHQVASRNIPLFNLGHDTYNLISKLPELQQNPDQRMSGKTGTLWLDNDNFIRRQLMCGQFKDGLVSSLGLGPIVKANIRSTLDKTPKEQAPQQNKRGSYKKSWLDRFN